jgi:hypothetical protein
VDSSIFAFHKANSRRCDIASLKVHIWQA